jgi:site-specific DNA-methyltransferase (adenine-specific)
MKKTKLMLGDNITSLRKLPDNSVDSIVTDPPYGLSFMGKKWDYDVPSVEFWKEVYRVLKPGGHVLSFGGTRTYHRMVVNIEDAGFEIRDQIMWLYGSGFPKSHNIGKSVDKLNGLEGEQGPLKRGGEALTYDSSNYGDIGWNAIKRNPYTYIAKNDWEGWGTALKPANEPICVARKPLSEKSVAENVLKWGTGGINIDGCRVGFNGDKPNKINCKRDKSNQTGWASQGTLADRDEPYTPNDEGRFPANIILECICDEVIKGEKGEVKKSNRRFEILQNKSDGKVERTEDYGDKGDIHTNPNCPCYMMDEQSGVSKARSKYPEPDISSMSMTYYDGKEEEKGVVKGQKKEQTKEGFSDKGGASRFFYQAKVSKAERNMGLDGFEEKEKTTHKSNFRCELCGYQKNSGTPCRCENPSFVEIEPKPQKNSHPTVKPVALMAYLVRLVTPPNGIVLDPFMGSGSTGIAAQLEGFRFLGMEMDDDYFKIAEARIENFESYRKFIK